MMGVYISHSDCLLHYMGEGHPEQPDRLRVIAEELEKSGLMANLTRYLAPVATKDQLARVHDSDYIDAIFQAAPQTGLISLDLDTWMNPYTLTAALRAAGAVVLGVDLVMGKTERVAFCNVRPPGHHAEKNRAMGFCFFNNLAVGVAHALEYHKLARIAIVDFDVHHGNGTEDIFQYDERVLLCSSFQHPFYPYSGFDTQSSHILNLPLSAGTDGEEYRTQVASYWFDALDAFKPELIFFSAGFDAHANDPLADLLLHKEDYAWITEKVAAIAAKHCQGRMVSTLEGGYSLDILGQCAVAHVRALSLQR